MNFINDIQAQFRKNMWFGPKAFHYACDKRGEAFYVLIWKKATLWFSHSVLGVCVASQEGAKQTALIKFGDQQVEK